MNMRQQKGYWVKRHERFTTRALAKSRATMLRQHQHISHVTVRDQSDRHEVSYAIATFYLDALKKAGVDL